MQDIVNCKYKCLQFLLMSLPRVFCPQIRSQILQLTDQQLENDCEEFEEAPQLGLHFPLVQDNNRDLEIVSFQRIFLFLSGLMLSFLLPFYLQRTADLKKEGNEAFSRGKFTAAVSAYSRALHVRYCIDQMQPLCFSAEGIDISMAPI